ASAGSGCSDKSRARAEARTPRSPVRRPWSMRGPWSAPASRSACEAPTGRGLLEHFAAARRILVEIATATELGEPELDALILLPALFGAVVGDRSGLSEPDGDESIALDPAIDEPPLHHERPLTGQLLVRGGIARVVGVPLDAQLRDAWVFFEE